MIDGFTIALLTAEFGQVWAKLGLRLQERSQDCIIVQLQTKDQLIMDNAGFKKSSKTSEEIVRLHNYAVVDKGSIDDGQRRD